MTKATVLLIEDDREISSTLTKVLETAGFDVTAVPNGDEGKKQLRRSVPDLVITDMMMPRLGGFPVLEYIQKLDEQPKIIMITANEGGRHKAYAETLGASAYLRKPFAMDLFLETVAAVLAEDDGDDE